MSNDAILMPGDQVFYIGQKHKAELTSKEGKPARGWIHSAVLNRPDTFVVEYPEAKDGDYVQHRSVLSKYRPSKTEARHDGPEIQPRRKKREEEEAK